MKTKKLYWQKYYINDKLDKKIDWFNHWGFYADLNADYLNKSNSELLNEGRRLFFAKRKNKKRSKRLEDLLRSLDLDLDE